MDHKYYVYAHRKIDGGFFYVGKGHAGRAFSKMGRSHEWAAIADSGYKVFIAASGLTEACSYSIEKIMIHLLGRNALCNKTSGGSGTSGSVKSASFIAARTGGKNPNFDPNIYKFHHLAYGFEECTRYDLCKKYQVKTESLGQVIAGKRSHTKGWHMEGEIPNFQKGLSHPAIDKTIYRFIHPEHGVRICTRYELSRDFSLNVSNLKSIIKGVNKVCKGWKLA